MKVISFLGGIPPRNNNPAKPAMLHAYVQGVNAVGDQGIALEGTTYQECDVAILQGFVHEHGKNAPHLQFRRLVHQRNTVKPKRCVIIDSNMFSYATGKFNNSDLIRFSFDGVFPTTGDYCNHDIDTPVHWDRLSNRYGLQLKPYTQGGQHILICLQRNGGWSMKGEHVIDWLRNTLTILRKHTNSPIKIRCHPGDKTALIYGKQIEKEFGVRVSDTTNVSLMDDLQGCWATVVKNSSPVVASLMNGIPIFATDPDYCQAGPLANTDLTQIETPQRPEREKWLWKLCASHWNLEELKNGDCWQHMKKYV